MWALQRSGLQFFHLSRIYMRVALLLIWKIGAMAEHFVGPVMEKLIDACFEYFKDQVRWQTGMKEALEELRENHHKIKAVLSVYSQTEIKDQALNKWYWQLRDAIDEADDVIDELEYQKLEKSIKKKRFVKSFQRAYKRDPTLKRLKKAVQKLSKISAEVGTFQNLLDRANQEQEQQQLELHEKREEGSIPTNELLGRSQQIEFISQWLRNPSQTENTNFYRNISLLCVVGHGGMGKTTLLQHVFSDGMMVGFDLKMWACVSNNFKPKTVIKNLLESLEEKRSDSETLEALQNTLKSKVTSKRFLLVLDDIWEANETEWKKVLAPLNYGSLGSKILITTRMNSVASMFEKMINNKQMLKLEGLEKDKCLQLFEKHAFFGMENPDDEYKSMAVKIVEKLSGCPLAAKVIGGILNSDVLDKSYWTKVLNANIGNIRSDQNHILPVLKLSYIYLPKFLQNCFAFCSVFPQDYEFDKDSLVRKWIAVGFIQSSNVSGEIDLEDTGRRYFNTLVQKSFLEEFHDIYGRVYYKMHDILRELAQSVSTEECLRVVDDRACSIPKTIRHLYIDISSSLEAAFKMMGEFKNLRSLFLIFSEAAKFDVNIISEIFKAWKSIRILVICVPKQQHIPETIDCLIHLRHLQVQFDSFSTAFKLPRSVRHLYHLQFIDFPKLQNLENLEMNNTGWKVLKTNENCQLITDILVIKDPCVLVMEPVRSITSLHALEIEENGELVSFPTGTEMFLQSSSLYMLNIQNLQSLQSLPSSLESLSSLGFLRVYNVPQLKLLPNPSASLTLLELCNLESLQCLPSSLSTISSLKYLLLKNIPLLKSLPDLPSSLIELTLQELESLQCQPSFLSTIPSLSGLHLKNIPLLKSLSDLPSSLKTLIFEELESLQCLPSSLLIISSLSYLKLKNIPLLKSLPDLPSSLKTLIFEELESLQCLPSSLSTISSLSYLNLKNIPLLKSLPDLPSALAALKFEELKSLQCLPSSLSTISSLSYLELKNIPLLKSLPDLPSSLAALKFEELKSLQCLPSSLSTISSLSYLRLKNIPLLKSLPDLPSSLRYLVLENLENLDCLPSCLPTLRGLQIIKVPRLQELPDLPTSLEGMYIKECHPHLMNRYKSFGKIVYDY